MPSKFYTTTPLVVQESRLSLFENMTFGTLVWGVQEEVEARLKRPREVYSTEWVLMQASQEMVVMLSSTVCPESQQ